MKNLSFFASQPLGNLLDFNSPFVAPLLSRSRSHVMLTSYLVKCPHRGCDFAGSLLPCQNAESWRSYNPTTKVAVFHCPSCAREWQARVVGDDVVSLPLQEVPELVHH